MTPAELSQELELPAKGGAAKGTRRGKRVDGGDVLWNENYWYTDFTSAVPSEPPSEDDTRDDSVRGASFERRLSNAIEELWRRRERVNVLRESGGRIEIYASISVERHTAFVLDRELVERCAALGISLGVELLQGTSDAAGGGS